MSLIETEFAVFTPAFYTDPNPPIQRIMDSCKHHKVMMVAYGIGRVYQPHGIVSHIIELANTLERFSGVRIAMMTDAYDSWVVTDAEEIVTKFENTDADIVIAGERDCWPVASIREKFPYSATPYRWINAGGVMGYRDRLITALKTLYATYGDGPGELQGNPQGLWSQGHVDGIFEGAMEVQIDTHCRIFQTMSGGAADDIQEVWKKADGTARPFNSATREWPCVIHHNGRCGDDEAVERSYRRFYPR